MEIEGIEELELLSELFPGFPNGYNSENEYTREHWITDAIMNSSLQTIKWMLSKNVNLHFIESDGYSVLHACLDTERPDKYQILQLLIDNGADIDTGAKLGSMAINSWTPLHMAAARNDLEAIKILLDAGADTAIKTIIDDYCTAEQEALIAGNREAAGLIRNYKPS